MKYRVGTAAVEVNAVCVSWWPVCSNHSSNGGDISLRFDGQILPHQQSDALSL